MSYMHTGNQHNRNLSQFPQHEMTRSIITPHQMGCQCITRLPTAFEQASLKICWCPFILLGGEKHCECRMFKPKNTTEQPDQGLKLDLLTQSSAHQTLSPCISHSCFMQLPKININKAVLLFACPQLFNHVQYKLLLIMDV